MSPPQIETPAKQLRDILALLSTAIDRLASEWESSLDTEHRQSNSAVENSNPIQSHVEYDAVKVALAALGSLESLIMNPYNRLVNLSMSYLLSRALHIVVEHNVADLLAQAGNDGVQSCNLARTVGIEEGKLCMFPKSFRSALL